MSSLLGRNFLTGDATVRDTVEKQLNGNTERLNCIFRSTFMHAYSLALIHENNVQLTHVNTNPEAYRITQSVIVQELKSVFYVRACSSPSLCILAQALGERCLHVH